VDLVTVVLRQELRPVQTYHVHRDRDQEHEKETGEGPVEAGDVGGVQLLDVDHDGTQNQETHIRHVNHVLGGFLILIDDLEDPLLGEVPEDGEHGDQMSQVDKFDEESGDTLRVEELGYILRIGVGVGMIAIQNPESAHQSDDQVDYSTYEETVVDVAAVVGLIFVEFQHGG